MIELDIGTTGFRIIYDMELIPNDVELNNDQMELILVPHDVELNNDGVGYLTM